MRGRVEREPKHFCSFREPEVRVSVTMSSNHMTPPERSVFRLWVQLLLAKRWGGTKLCFQMPHDGSNSDSSKWRGVCMLVVIPIIGQTSKSAKESTFLHADTSPVIFGCWRGRSNNKNHKNLMQRAHTRPDKVGMRINFGESDTGFALYQTCSLVNISGNEGTKMPQSHVQCCRYVF